MSVHSIATPGAGLRLPLSVTAGVVCLLAVALGWSGNGLTRHMAAHVVLMNALAPCLALVMLARLPRLGAAVTPTLASATLAQIACLWGAHAPALQHLAAARPAVAFSMQAILLLTALWFWLAVLAQPPERPWRALAALLVTGKLFCLLGALLVFAGHPLLGHATHGAVDPLADQQAAGLLMVIACPLSYVLTAVILTAHWLRGLQQRDRLPASGAMDRA
jgi:putative membrane protein